jgi:glycosyltransferase involved in cell wall biosynthesis
LKSIGIIYITWNRLDYVRQSLPALLKRTGMDFSLFIVDNSSTDGTLDYVSRSLRDKRIKAVIRNGSNMRQRIPTNWLWENCGADLLGKFDDDIMVPDGWLEGIAGVFDGASKRLGAVGGCHFHSDDIMASDYNHNIVHIGGGVRVVRQPYIGGCCYLIPREVIKENGLINTNWTNYQNALHRKGYINGYVYPFIKIMNMDDPRTGLKNPEYKSSTHPTRPFSYWIRDSRRLLEGRWMSP